ncbi:MAG: alpha/beta hydrolase [Nitratireductor sp.]
MNPQFMSVGDTQNSRQIAFRRTKGSNDENLGVVWLGGYRSDMLGSKAQVLQDWADESNNACLRFDYSGHGESQLDGAGDFMLGNISRWLEESLAVFGSQTEGKQILVGSSMGCWIALRMLQELKTRGEDSRIVGMILIAPAPDFASELTWPRMSHGQQETVERDGFIKIPTPDPQWFEIYTKNLFDDAKNNIVLDAPIIAGCPIHILQGSDDDIVPVAHAVRLAELLPSEELTMSIVKGGDHRLSRDEDLQLLKRALDQMANA